MSNRNNKNDEMTIITMVLGVLAMAAIFAAVFICALLTFFCILAWNEKRRFFGSTITPYEARSFIRAGLIGALGCSAAGLYFLLNGSMDPSGFWYCLFGGYIVGSLGWAVHHSENMKADEQRRTIEPVPPPPPPNHKLPHHSQTREHAFQYASWDDEEPRS